LFSFSKYRIPLGLLAVQIRFLWIGETKNGSYRELEDSYYWRVAKLIPCERAIVPELKKSDRRSIAAQQDREGKMIERKLGKNTFLVSLDETGKELTSVELADTLRTLIEGGISSITFLVGGFMGIPSTILQRSNLKISLSKLTFPHELARVVLLEQIYRSMSIVKNFPYHR
jgi:23S rRNA (pseudouridine1915-N3)-methyltransferase